MPNDAEDKVGKVENDSIVVSMSPCLVIVQDESPHKTYREARQELIESGLAHDGLWVDPATE